MKSFIKHSILIILYSLIFVAIYGYINFDIHYTDWCMLLGTGRAEDISVNYLNFFSFLNDSASIPYYENMIYPFKGSFLFIDYTPIIALPVKIFYRYIISIY